MCIMNVKDGAFMTKNSKSLCELQGGLPLDVKFPTAMLDIRYISKAQLGKELEHGYREMLDGKTVTAQQAFAEEREKYKL